jgi:hypothetical protein
MFKHGSILSGKTRLKRVSSQWHSTTINTALLRTHCLSKAVLFILTNEDAEIIENGSTYRAAIEEVNELAREAI